MKRTEQPSFALDRESSSLHRQIVDYMRDQILSGNLKEGDVLPSERELAQRFGVSRMPVREALRILEYLGVVRHMRGKGEVVQRVNLGRLLTNVAPLLMETPSVLSDLYAVRLVLEEYAAALAARHCTDEDLAAIEASILSMEEGMHMGEPVEEPSLDFHTHVLGASKNKVLQMINIFLSEMQRFARKRTFQSREMQEMSLQYHKTIFSKIRNRDEQGSATAMREHLLYSGDRLEKRLKNSNGPS